VGLHLSMEPTRRKSPKKSELASFRLSRQPEKTCQRKLRILYPSSWLKNLSTDWTQKKPCSIRDSRWRTILATIPRLTSPCTRRP